MSPAARSLLDQFHVVASTEDLREACHELTSALSRENAPSTMDQTDTFIAHLDAAITQRRIGLSGRPVGDGVPFLLSEISVLEDIRKATLAARR